jgi:hypothetical protein
MGTWRRGGREKNGRRRCAMGDMRYARCVDVIVHERGWMDTRWYGVQVGAYGGCLIDGEECLGR